MTGFLVVIIGSLCLAAQNVLLRVMFAEGNILGQFLWGGFVEPSVGNSLLILQIRSLLILPVMLAIAPSLYPNSWKTLRRVVQVDARSLLTRAVLSSSFLFLALALLFIAIAFIPAGIATVLFFTHPVTTGLLSWRLFGDRPTALRVGVMVVVMVGSVLVAPVLQADGSPGALLGILAALGASLAYSAQGLLAQTCFQDIHPVPFTLINFIVMLGWSVLCLLLFRFEVPPDAWTPLWIISAVAALLTLAGQLLYNVGIHLVNAALMAIIAVSNPMLTAAIAWVSLQEMLTGRQMAGMLLVVAGIVALGRERMMLSQQKT
ncbi:MAG: DMT family transporter [Kaiparowitsia implicata GSE-PSE-MK54-09C]|jgi:drug/metabolite transporter (DMT)-like permease|nr:DMT family transporter [Kaiparowitsia implicata GSE-PSE-MK54-09C]